MSRTEWLPAEEQSWLGRLLWHVVGEERMKRWVLRMEDRHPWLVPPEGETRCPWVAPLDRTQCTQRVGHKGYCRTERTLTNKQTGKSYVEPLSWRGINYDVS